MNRYILSILIFISSSFWSCEKNKNGSFDPTYSTPRLISTTINYSSFNLDSASTNYVDSLGSNRYRLHIQITAIAVAQQSSPADGIIMLFKPKGTSPFAKFSFAGVMLGTDSIIYSKNIEITIQRSDIGTFKLEVYLHSVNGLFSNSVVKTFYVTRKNSYPQVESVSMPDSLTIGHIPSTDSSFLVSATVADSDGISDINFVGFYSIKPDGSIGNCGNLIQLFDDGSQNIIFPPNFRSGDLILGDGIYSFRLPLLTRVRNNCPPPDSVNTQRGDYTFVFFAFDMSGASSDSVKKVIKVK